MQQLKHLLPTVQSLELVKPETTPCAISDESELALCLSEPKIRQSPQEAIRQALRYAMLLVGLRAANFPKDEEKAVLIAYVMENYGGHTVSEIRLAFKMAVSGSLDVEANCYENFSVLYFSGIMNAYRQWAREAVKQVVKQKSLEYRPSKHVIEMEYAYCKLKEKNKLPCKIYVK